MKRFKAQCMKYVGRIAMAVALFSMYTGHPHCILIIHQPDVPEGLKRLQRE